MVVPAHWPVEILNALLMARRRGRLADHHVREFIDDLAALAIRMELAYSGSEWSALPALAETHHLTAYDAGLNLSLATLDQDLRRSLSASHSPSPPTRPTPRSPDSPTQAGLRLLSNWRSVRSGAKRSKSLGQGACK